MKQRVRRFCRWVWPLVSLAGTIAAVWWLWFEAHDATRRNDATLLVWIGIAYLIAIAFLLSFTRRWTLRGLGQIATYGSDAMLYLGLGGAGLGWWSPFSEGQVNLIRAGFVVGGTGLVLGLVWWMIVIRSENADAVESHDTRSPV